jgi:CheY-like chemotaxis protein
MWRQPPLVPGRHGVPTRMTNLAIRPGLRVLVAEDEALVSMLIEDMLAEMGAVVVGPASTFNEALTLAGEVEADVAVLDVNLAGKPIFPVADALRARGIPYIFASGYGEAGIIEAHRGAAVLQKPFREADLARALHAIAPA